MANASVGGLVSGLDTSTIISQLMQVESQPQTVLKNRLSSQQSVVSSLQGLNAKLAAIATKAHDLASPAAWSPLVATSSSTSVTAVAGPTARPSALAFTVNRTARAHELSFSLPAQGTDVVTGADHLVSLEVHGTTLPPIDTGDGTLNGLVAAVNKAGAGVTASTVRLDGGALRLRVVSDATGEASDFTLTNLDGTSILGGATATPGADAEIKVGQDLIHSATNTFTGLTQGVDVTLASATAAGTAVDLALTADTSTASTALKGLVDAANDILTQIDGLTSYDAKTGKSGVLAGDPTVRDLRTQVLNTITGGGGSMASLGVQTDRYGHIVFDAAKFASAYAADPAAVSAKLGARPDVPVVPGAPVVPGFAARLEKIAKGASDSTSGSLTVGIQSRQSSATTMQRSIEDWDVRLVSKKDTLSRQYAALEVALGKMQNQASWLAGQIASLPSSSS
jgi:flagellar hook-associated protein 2